MDQEFKNVVVTRIIQMLTPSPTKEDVQRISKHFVESRCDDDVYKLRQFNKKLVEEVRQWRSLGEPITDRKISWLSCLSYLLIGSLTFYILQVTLGTRARIT
tara:strand:- start:8106 stop:8411 length:306 start_codon:yes stop_codon:yes gene_type:complete